MYRLGGMAALPDLELRHLAALVAVADEGSFARAAAALGFTQSAVSQQIAALERAIGMPVFDRPKGPRAAELTPAGELLLGHARTVLARVTDVADELDRLRRGVTGRLVIGTFQSVSAELLPAIIQRMRAAATDVDLQLVETDDQDRLIHGLLTDELDLSFTVDLDDPIDLEARLLGFDPFVVITPADDDCGPTIHPNDLDRRPTIGQPNGNACQRLLERRLEDLAVHPDYVFRSQDNGAVQGMVRSGMGRAIMPRLAVDADDPRTRIVPFDPPLSPRAIQLTRRAGRTLPPAADTLADIAGEVAADRLEPATANV